jgi:hypothetical protein
VSFTPSTDRNALDRLLRHAPHLDLLGIEIRPDFLVIDLGQPGEGSVDAWARWRYLIDRRSGAVYQEHSERDLRLLNI